MSAAVPSETRPPGGPPDAPSESLPGTSPPASPAASFEESSGTLSAAAGEAVPVEQLTDAERPLEMPVAEHHVPPSVLNKPKVAAGLGIAASVLVHVTLITAGLLLIPKVREIVTGRKVAEQTIVPTAELATEQVGGIPNPGLNNDRNRANAQNTDPSVTQSDAWASQKSANLDKQLLGGSGDSAPTQIGIGGAKSAGRGLGAGVAGGGGLAKFGVPGGGSGIGPRGAVFGNGGNAYRIVFVCDGTGGMFDGRKTPLLMRELRNTIAKLKPKQSYDVLFFKEGSDPDASKWVTAVDKAKLLPAVPANTDKTRAFLDTFTFGGATRPTPAIDLAFRLKPQLVYFLSDGAFNDLETYEQVIARFRELNKDKSVRVNTIVFAKNADTSEEIRQAQETMKTISKENGGNFLSVDPDAVFGQG